MSPPLDPKPESDEGEAEAELSGGSVAELQAAGDVAALLALARAHRSGDGAPRDLRRCLEAYRAASDLGDGDAAYAVALFLLTGGVVTQDLKEGAALLRTAAERGNVQAKVYLGNLYELGIHYKADAEKADVWYRNAARSADVDPDAEDLARQMAELGCVRHYLALKAEGSLSPEEEEALGHRSRAHGYLLKLREDNALERASTFDPLAGARLSAVPGGAAPAGEAEAGATAKAREAPAAASPVAKAPTKSGPSQARVGLGAFAYAMLFMLTGVGAGYAAMRGAEVLVARGQMLPVLGARAALLLPILTAVIGVLPCILVYRLGAVAKAAVLGAMFAGVGWVAWGTGEGALIAQRGAQTLAFGAAGYLAGILVVGMMGGAKGPKRRKR